MLCNLCQNIHFKPYLELAKEEKLYLLSYCEEWQPDEPGHYTEEEVLNNDFRYVGGPGQFFYFHHRNLESLGNSANAGCDFCIQMFFGLPDTMKVKGSSTDDYDRIYLHLVDPTDLYTPEAEHMWSGDLDVRFGEESLGNLRLKDVQDFAEFVPSLQSMEENSNTGSPMNLDLGARWLRDCADNHEYCHRQPHLEPILPHRVLDLGLGEAPQKISLSVGEGRRGSYAALSYCWGEAVGEPKHLTTVSNYESRKTVVDESTFPQTISDAVVVCRYLGIRFLWIDSLCIVQDDRSDWQTQSRLMGDIYSNASLTISAALGEDSHAGLFFQRDARKTYPCTLSLRYPKTDGVITKGTFLMCHDWYTPDTAVLDKRGWTLQEKYLSPRTICFSQTGISWTCASKIASEGFPMGLIPLNNKSDFDRYIRNDAAGSLSQELPLRTRFHWWYELVEAYSHRVFTNESDRLIAVAGLAAKFKSPGDELFYGIWKSDLAYGLAWRVTDIKKGGVSAVSSSSPVPSWSWASHPGKLISYAEDEREGVVMGCNYSIISTYGNPTDLPVTFFEVLFEERISQAPHLVPSPASPSLKLRGLIRPIAPERSFLPYYLEKHQNPFLLFGYGYSSKTPAWKKFFANAFCDEPVTSDESLFCLPLNILSGSDHGIDELASLSLSIGDKAQPDRTWCAGPKAYRKMGKSDALRCLLLKKVDGGAKYRRVGYLELLDGRVFNGVSPSILEII
ncbi:heterokaryon incompatibility protein-domain-containing protein [Cadophora sp. MPI-SDFR-AT-0126]|nr:heterokaryon incompatibility protein-domain-containing protein [Leotiomycetes sp. MPI-SDFR-AT-0126]